MCTPITEKECAQQDTQECTIVQEEKCEVSCHYAVIKLSQLSCQVVYETELGENCDNQEEQLCRDVVRNVCSKVTEEKCETR